MSNCEQIAQVAHVKRVTKSKKLRLLMTNEQLSDSLVFSEQIAHSLFCWQKTSYLPNKIWLKLYFLVRFWYVFLTSNFLILSFLMSDVSKLLRSLTRNEWCERIAQVAHQQWATMSNSLRSLTKKYQPKIEGMSKSLVVLANRSFAHFFAKNEQLAQKTDEQIPNPDKRLSKTFLIRPFNLM